MKSGSWMDAVCHFVSRCRSALSAKLRRLFAVPPRRPDQARCEECLPRASRVECSLALPGLNSAGLNPVGREIQASILIPFHNRLELTRQCIESIDRHVGGPCFELVLIDNASTDGSGEWAQSLAQRQPIVKLIRNTSNESFARANNRALQAATGHYVVFLNNDTIVTRDWLARLLSHLEHDPTIGIIGPVTNSIGNEARITVAYTGLDGIEAFAERRSREHEGKTFDIAMSALFCAAMRRDLLLELGGLDERFEFMFEDDDLAMRVRQAGYRVVCAEDVFVHHFHGSTNSRLKTLEYRRLFAANRRRYEEKWGPWRAHRYRDHAA